MSHYRRRNYDDGSPLTVNFLWDQLSGAYKFNFSQPQNDRHWSVLKMVVDLIKNKIPYGERDYDDVTKIWYLSESNYQWLFDFLVQLPGVTLNTAKKPEGQTTTTQFIPVEVSIGTLEKLSGLTFKGLDKPSAIKMYRKAAMQLHPDRHPDDPEAGARMSQFNASWQKLQEQGYFK